MAGRPKKTILDKMRTASFISETMKKMEVASPTALGKELPSMDLHLNEPCAQARLWARGERILSQKTVTKIATGAAKKTRKASLESELINIFNNGPEDLWLALEGDKPPKSFKDGPTNELQKLVIHIYILRTCTEFDIEHVINQNLINNHEIIPSCVNKKMYFKLMLKVFEKAENAVHTLPFFAPPIEEKFRKAGIQMMLKKRPDRLFLDQISDDIF